MPKSFILVALLVLSSLTATVLAQPPAVEPAPVDGCEVIARVNGQVILSREVLWEANLILTEKADKIPPGKADEVRNAIMQQRLMSMLDMKMLYADFRRKVPEANLAAIHESLSKRFEENDIPGLMKKVGVETPQELPGRLIELGTSLREREEDFYQRMISRSWVQEQVQVDREVTRDQLLEYYRENSAEFEYPTQARWEELMMRFSRFKTKAEAYRALAALGNDAYRAAVAQPDRSQPAFEALAKSKSQGFTADEGGQQDWTTQGALAADTLDQALFTLPIGEMSPILESKLGFHIVRVLERKQAGKTPFTEVQEEITSKIRNKRFQVAVEEKLDELRRGVRIWTKYTGNIDPVEYAAGRMSSTKRR